MTGPVDPGMTWQGASPPPEARPAALPNNTGFTEAELEQVATSGAVVSLVISAVFLAAYGFVAVVLQRRGEVFD